ncbi:hypothetical protein L226DRAFT_234779 [Lentinus tigrinus ALCF2SS1-7]|uniref:F-box domain-containing protein n=1 Tax=Lentinus tigrinus ALCF2SS1-6 TaxID=1328759 RepID=A0A5C2SPF8_9APHY|nr:hypothetical protein L227DRAFT_219561 [Lentinus tigrinus ALCF2SS1-6]RPD78883.1 hypothetical protein L226DRAFT_234779 [Lentinus tigrinus ALCF2SS1-7]
MLTTIHDLPIELIIHVFRCFSPTDRSDICLSHVCSLWRAALQRTPEFWAKFLTFPSLITQDHYERSIAFWYSFVERTRPQHLRVRLDGGNFDLLKTIPEHLQRLLWLHVQWRTANPRDVQRRLLALGSLPTIEHLQLACDFPAPVNNYPDLEAAELAELAPLVEEYPRLRHLEVNPDFFIPSMVVGSLKTLIIHRGHMSFSTLLLTLRQCPGLESLRLSHVLPRDPLDTSSQQVILPNLRDLSLSYTDYPCRIAVQHLLFHMRCPSMAQLAVSMSHWTLAGLFPENEPLPLARLLAQLVVRISNSHHGAPRTYALLIEGYVDGTARNMPPQLRIFNRHSPWANPHRWEFSPIPSIVHEFRYSAIRDLELCLLDAQLSMKRPDSTALFEAFPTLVSLAVQITSCLTLFKTLRHKPLCLPKLESLTLECGNGSGVHHKLVVTLEARAWLGHRLQLLRFRHLNPDNVPISEWHLARLREVIVGEITVG